MTPKSISPIVIREANRDDLQSLVDFNMAMAFETENLTLDSHRLRAGVQRMLDGKAEGLYLIAEHEGEIDGTIASMMVTHEWSDWRCGLFWWIQSVYVVPHARRRGVFSALYRHLEAMARADDECCGLRLYVEQENRTAMLTYRHLGMQQCHYRMFEVDFSTPPDDQ